MTTTSGRYLHISNIKSLYDIFDVSDFNTHSDEDTINDYYEKKIDQGILRLGDGLLDSDELEITFISDGLNDNEQIVYVRMKSHPVGIDTDGDGYIDSEDERPKEWDVSDRDLVMLSQLAYTNLFSPGTLIEYETSQNSAFYGGTATMAEMQGWTLVDSSDEIDDSELGFYVATYKKDDNYIIAFRGSEIYNFTDFIQDWIIAGFQGILLNQFNYQAFFAQQYVDKIIDEISDLGDNKIFITGHSLGGYLAQIAIIKFYNYDEYQDNIIKSVNFNAPGINSDTLESLTNVDKISKYIENWIVKDEKNSDIVSSNEKIGQTHSVEYGYLTNEEYKFATSFIGTHMLNSFLEDDRFKLDGRSGL